MRIQLYGDDGAYVFAERDGRMSSLPQMCRLSGLTQKIFVTL